MPPERAFAYQKHEGFKWPERVLLAAEGLEIYARARVVLRMSYTGSNT